MTLSLISVASMMPVTLELDRPMLEGIEISELPGLAANLAFAQTLQLARGGHPNLEGAEPELTAVPAPVPRRLVPFVIENPDFALRNAATADHFSPSLASKVTS